MIYEQFDITQPWPEKLHPLMHKLYHILVKHNALGDFNESMGKALNSGVQDLKDLNIKTAADYLWFMSRLLTWAPFEHKDGTWVYTNLVVFYWVFNLTPLGNNACVQTQIIPQNVGKKQAAVTKWLVEYAITMGEFMTTTDSWSPKALATFEQAKNYNMQWYQGPWSTFNEFFCRHLKVPRPVDGEGDDRVIVSPADCTYKSEMVHVNSMSEINVKGMLWDIDGLLAGSGYLKGGEFANGTFVHAFLAPYDYHRQHAPVAGTIREAKIVHGQCYLQVVLDENPKDGGAPRLKPIRPIPRPSDPNEVSDLDAPDGTGYQFLQSRGIIVIENDNLGLVACLPVGMAQVSSVKTNLKVGQTVKKGEEISWFELGGSDVIMVFQEQAKVKLTVNPHAHPPPHMLQGQAVISAGY